MVPWGGGTAPQDSNGHELTLFSSQPSPSSPEPPVPPETDGAPRGKSGVASARDAQMAKLLAACQRGEEGARARLFAALHEELQARAGALVRQQGGRHDLLRAAAIVQELHARLAGGEPDWGDRAQFLSAASRAMRRLLLDRARARRKGTLPAGEARVEFEELLDRYQGRAHDVEALDRALKRLEEFNPVMAQAVELRFFGGAGVEETAQLLGMTRRVFEKRWEAVRAWLRVQIR